jgi:protein-S-isoprenylcysteine O-methyltransferase Ste14
MDQLPHAVSDNIPFEADTMASSPSERRSAVEQLRKPISASFVALLVGLIWWSVETSNPTWRLVETVFGFSLAATAVLGRVWCAMYISGRKNAELCMKGPYSLCRNPLYLFSSLGLCGIVLASHRPLCALLALAVFWCYHLLLIRDEELRLADRFGSTYDDYRARVPAVWPRMRSYADVASITINLRPMLRAFGEVGWFLAAWLIVHLVFLHR